MVDLVDLVSAVFSFQGFTVADVNRRGPSRASGVVVRRGPLEIAIAVVPGALTLDSALVEELLAELVERAGARHLIVYGGAAPSGARAAAAAGGAVLWERERLLAEAGLAFVGLADPDPFVPAPPSSSLDSVLATAPAAPPARRAGARGAAGLTLHPARTPDPEAPLGALPVALPQESARAAAEGALRSRVLRLDLEWAPAYLVDYHVEVEVRTPRGEEALIASGTLLVFAGGGEVEEVERPLEVVAVEEAGPREALARAARRRRLQPSEARERAREESLARAVRTVENVSERGAVKVIERQTWRPTGNAVDLVVRGVLFVPLFLAETDGGAVTVDAATGKVVRVAPFEGERAPGGTAR